MLMDVWAMGVLNRALNGLSKVVVPGLITLVSFWALGIPSGLAISFGGAFVVRS